MYKTIVLEISDNKATITLNRPEVYNAFNTEMSFELQGAIKEVAKNKAVRVLVITGAGKAFCSGQDLKEVQAAGQRSLMDSVQQRYNPLIRAMRNLPKPIICRLNGIAAGAGCSLALACDMIIASEEAALLEAFVNIGLVLDSGSSFFLPRLTGMARAFELATTGRKITAREALQYGLVNQVVPADELDKAVGERVAYYASAPTKAIGLIKKLLNQSFHSDLDTMLEAEACYQEIAGRSKDYKEGVAAFLEKRKPRFTGE
ncbi:MAG: 2-(1,2-epoxy-1,2-dihydrophenyl)acetyl-CoA isomerase [Chitinophagales bacterium]|nr:MAG: 2-(1,2-epoxy-1,2-dihydrophenyl)acetyl-CoA isomerase [Chitinophagales bacterium]